MGDDFWGFWMLGGMAGGGMGFLFRPGIKERAQDEVQRIMSDTKRRLESAVPFAMEPVVYDFAINERGTSATLLGRRIRADAAVVLTPLMVPSLLRADSRTLSPQRRSELGSFSNACRVQPEYAGMAQNLFDHLLPRAAGRPANRPTGVSARCSKPTALTACNMNRFKEICGRD